jgi:hypothetical protein
MSSSNKEDTMIHEETAKQQFDEEAPHLKGFIIIYFL